MLSCGLIHEENRCAPPLLRLTDLNIVPATGYDLKFFDHQSYAESAWAPIALNARRRV